MTQQITFLNGDYVPHDQAYVHVEDRGFVFADGVYDFILVHGGVLINEEAHLDRLNYSLGELEIPWPLPRTDFKTALREVIRRNELTNGFVYIQFTRGVAPRDHPFPKDIEGTSVIIARPLPYPSEEEARKGCKVITTEDQRWKRCDIKSIALLPNILARQKAMRADAYEAWMFDDEGFITEGPACNAWIVTEDGTIVTRYLDRGILKGITRTKIFQQFGGDDIRFEERKFSIEEAKSAREAFLTNSPFLIKPVVRIDDTVIGDGEIGPVTLKLLKAYRAFVESQSGE
ncbi:MAG: D-amino-acid transaminase [Rhodospirillales bacterium]|nr:D-amino-acid transaminase [Rhodospirillales bacterium]